MALGCARFAHMLLESSPNHKDDTPVNSSISNSHSEEKKEEQDSSTMPTNCVVEEQVLLSPVGIGLSLQEGDPASIVMIEKQTPLPALVTKQISLSSSTTRKINCALSVVRIGGEV